MKKTKKCLLECGPEEVIIIPQDEGEPPGWFPAFAYPDKE